MRKTSSFGSLRRVALAGLLAGAALAAMPVSQAAAGDADFKTYAGRWVGGGTIKLSDGASESIKCKATYFVVSGGNGLEQNIRCASASYKFEVRSAMQQSGGAISGSWQETQNNSSGSLSGKATSAGLKLNVAGDKFSAFMSVLIDGSSQTVSIVPQGIAISSVTIGLRKG